MPTAALQRRGFMAPRSALLEKERFAWMIGATVASVTSDGPDYWSIDFSNGGWVQLEPGGAKWRLSLPNGIVVGSDDHGQQFGLPAPVDSSAQATAAIGKA